MFYYKITLICLLICVYQTLSEVSDLPHKEQNISHGDTTKIVKIADDKLALFVNGSSIPAVRQGRETLQKMCIQNAGNDSYDKADVALNNMKNCFDEIIKFAELPSRVEQAKPTGELDSVFKDYCKRTEELKGCIVKFLADVEPCLAENQKSSKYTIQNITEAILKFACEFEGDHIALFISEQGPECIFNKQHGIQECIKTRINDTGSSDSYEQFINKTKFENLTEIGSTAEQPLSLDFELEQCRTAFDIRKCIIRELSACSGSTPANVVESIFNLVQNSTSCSKFSQKQLDPDYNGASMSVSRSMFSIIIPAFTILLVRFLS